MAVSDDKDVVADELGRVLAENMQLVLQKFFELYGQVYSDTVVIEAMTKALINLNQNHLYYLCDICGDSETEQDFEIMKDNLYGFIEWYHESNLEIINEKFGEKNED